LSIRLEENKVKRVLFLLGIIILMLSGCSAEQPPQSSMSEHWQNTKNLYRMAVTYAGENDSLERHLELSIKSETLLKQLLSQKNAFVIDTYNYQPIDEKGTRVYEYSDLNGLPIEIAPNGYCIRISETYLKYNPVRLPDNSSWDGKIIYDDKTLNILVPQKFEHEELRIIKAYKELFYFEKVEVANIYNEELGNPFDTTSIDDLVINIIYVSDGQTYFTYYADRCPEDDNLITDPVVVVYTNNIHSSYAHSFMSQCVFFESQEKDAISAYKDIEPLIEACNASESYKKVYSVFEENKN